MIDGRRLIGTIAEAAMNTPSLIQYGVANGTDPLLIVCAAGKYASNIEGTVNPVKCQDCVPGKYLDRPGSDKKTDCVPCESGKFSAEAGAVSSAACKDCGAGKFAELTGNDSEDDMPISMLGKQKFKIKTLKTRF